MSPARRKPAAPGAKPPRAPAPTGSPGRAPGAPAPTTDRAPRAQAPDRILAAAAGLFARRGFAAVGVREIAAEAEVNLSMISYYFGGKVGLLTEIVTRFFDAWQAIVESNLRSAEPFEQKLHSLVRDLVHALTRDHDVWKVGFLELPHDLPEITELKADRVRRLRELFASAPDLHGTIPPEIEQRLPILGPAFASIVFSTFLLEPVVDHAFATTHDPAFTEHYIHTIAILFSRGITGLLPPPGANPGVGPPPREMSTPHRHFP
ncbi:MAG: TetR family transcriptional regulator [Spirochaetaceae bacterium]|nr:MAG: TetR family transcriptional regulator [Spirochaetaceae bacterium]